MTNVGRPRLGRAAGALTLLAALVAGCTDDPGGTPRLQGGAPTLEALGQEVWGALVRGDTAALDGLRLSEHEHNELVWPEQPAAREPSAAANLDLWWRNIELRNAAAVSELLARYRDSSLRLEAVECAGEPRRYETFQALTGCRLVLSGEGGTRTVEAFRHVIRMDGVHKVVRFYEDE